MRYVFWTLMAILFLFVLMFLHYTLPQRDTVRIVNTEVQRMDLGSNSIFWASPDAGSDTTRVNRDVRFIETFYENGRPMVFRNEDTGWGWPPYFKFDSANLQAVARDLVSTQTNPTWVEVTHYGWRNEWFTIFPNAVSMRPVAGPDDGSVNWFNILFFTVVLIIAFLIWRVIRRFKERQLERIENNYQDIRSEAGGRARGLWRRISGR